MGLPSINGQELHCCAITQVLDHRPPHIRIVAYVHICRRAPVTVHKYGREIFQLFRNFLSRLNNTRVNLTRKMAQDKKREEPRSYAREEESPYSRNA